MSAAHKVDDESLRAHVLAAAGAIRTGRQQVLSALTMIEAFMKVHAPARSLPTQLLALRRYLRMAQKTDLEGIWSWTEAEAKANANREPTRTLYVEAARAQRNFANANPGYRLVVTPVRSLERQIALWGQSTSVKEAGQKVLAAMRAELASGEYGEPPLKAVQVNAFSLALARSQVSPEPTNAAPGTSDHGRGVAVDFIVMRGDVTVAGIESKQVETVWKKQGWEAKLISACTGTRLRGPLQNPYESWHWCLGQPGQ